MRRRLHLILAALTVLLLAAWFPSGRWAGQVSIGPRPYVFVSAYEGRVAVGTVFESPYERSSVATLFFCDFMADHQVPYRLRWLPRWSRHDSTPSRALSLSVPLWLCALLTGAPAVILWRRHRRRRQHERADACPACGYDLAGLQAGATCPECGT